MQGRNKAEIEEAHGPSNEHGLEPAKKKRAVEKDEAPALLGVPLINVVTETPGIPWFSEMFLERLGMLA